MSDFNKIHKECHERYILAIEPYIKELAKLEMLQSTIVIVNEKGEYQTKADYSPISLRVKEGIEQIIESIGKELLELSNKENRG